MQISHQSDNGYVFSSVYRIVVVIMFDMKKKAFCLDYILSGHANIRVTFGNYLDIHRLANLCF